MEAAGAVCRNLPVSLGSVIGKGLLDQLGVGIHDGLLFGVIGSGHLPVGACVIAARPVDDNGGAVGVFRRELKHAAF